MGGPLGDSLVGGGPSGRVGMLRFGGADSVSFQSGKSKFGGGVGLDLG